MTDLRSVPIDSLRLHPDASRVPPATGADLESLQVSLREHGQQDPIDITADREILDGRTRWMLLQQEQAKTVLVRVVDVPPDLQTAYIVERAVARRHLTPEQKQQLNALLRTVVIEVVVHPVTQEEVRVGMSTPERAAKLGVDRATIKRWDTAESRSGA